MTGGRADDIGLDEGFLDPYEWSADIAELICARSAVIRLGARIVFDGDELPVPALEPLTGAPTYVRRPSGPKEGNEPRPIGESEEKPSAKLSEGQLHPRDHELAVKVVLPNRLARDLAENPDLAWALKEDIAEALAFGMDQAFLHGQGNPDPRGLRWTPGVVAVAPAAGAGADLLALVRQIVGNLRRGGSLFRNPGWVLHPSTLDGLTRLQTTSFQRQDAMGRSMDSTRLLEPDGYDGGNLLGYPFVVSAAAEDGRVTRVYFGSDWSEAWIGVDGDLATVDISTEAHFQTDETVIRAGMHHDFVLRRPSFFAYSDRATGYEKVEDAGGVTLTQAPGAARTAPTPRPSRARAAARKGG